MTHRRGTIPPIAHKIAREQYQERLAVDQAAREAEASRAQDARSARRDAIEAALPWQRAVGRVVRGVHPYRKIFPSEALFTSFSPLLNPQRLPFMSEEEFQQGISPQDVADAYRQIAPAATRPYKAIGFLRLVASEPDGTPDLLAVSLPPTRQVNQQLYEERAQLRGVLGLPANQDEVSTAISCVVDPYERLVVDANQAAFSKRAVSVLLGDLTAGMSVVLP